MRADSGDTIAIVVEMPQNSAGAGALVTEKGMSAFSPEECACLLLRTSSHPPMPHPEGNVLGCAWDEANRLDKIVRDGKVEAGYDSGTRFTDEPGTLNLER